MLIDVREPYEYAGGHIPNAVNVPLDTSPEGLFLDPEEFEDKFGFTKPDSKDEVLFYCKAGIRSEQSATLAKKAGYVNVNEYRGSWNDWVANQGPIEGGSQS